MIGFYYQAPVESCNLHKLSILPYSEFHTMKDVQEGTLYLFFDSKALFVKEGQKAAYIVGSFIFKGLWGNEALSAFLSSVNDNNNISELMSYARGQFCMAFFTPNGVTFIMDKMGTFPIYHYRKGNREIISSILLPVVRREEVTIDIQGIAEYLSFGYCFNGTFFKEISLLRRGTYYSYTNEATTKEYYNYIENCKVTKQDLKETTQEIIMIFRECLNPLKSVRCVFSDMTGGFDTRLINTVLHDSGLCPQTGICGEQVLHETKIAQQVSSTLGCVLNKAINIETKELFQKTLNIHYEISNGIPIYLHSTELINYYQKIRDHNDVHLTGYAGSQLFDNFIPKLSLFSEKLRSRDLVLKSFNYSDIFRREFINKTLFQETIIKKLNYLMEEFGSYMYSEVANFVTTSTFSKYYHGGLVAAHNTILPVYNPFLEADVATFMYKVHQNLKQNRMLQRNILSTLNQDVSEIMTTHGYAANIESIPPVLFKQKFKNILRRISYDLPFLILIEHGIEQLLKKIIGSKSLAEKQRRFWTEYIDNIWSDDMLIFKYLDRQKLKKHFSFTSEVYLMKAKIIYLEKLFREIKYIN